jgi:hypothetical protein
MGRQRPLLPNQAKPRQGAGGDPGLRACTGRSPRLPRPRRFPLPGKERVVRRGTAAPSRSPDQRGPLDPGDRPGPRGRRDPKDRPHPRHRRNPRDREPAGKKWMSPSRSRRRCRPPNLPFRRASPSRIRPRKGAKPRVTVPDAAHDAAKADPKKERRLPRAMTARPAGSGVVQGLSGTGWDKKRRGFRVVRAYSEASSEVAKRPMRTW